MPGKKQPPQTPAADPNCTVTDGANPMQAVGAFTQGLVGGVAKTLLVEPLNALGTVSNLATQGRMGANLQASTQATLDDLDRCKNASAPARVGHIVGSVGGTVGAVAVTGGGSPLVAGGLAAADELGVNPTNKIIQSILPPRR